jgi:hypothetical protein
VARELHASVRGLWLASPVYDPAGDRTGASASAPIPDAVVVTIPGEDAPVVRALEELGWSLDAGWSALFPALSRVHLTAGNPDDGFEWPARLEAVAGVASAELDWLVLDPHESPPPGPPPTPHWDRQWNLVEARFPEAWQNEAGRPSVAIAVIDTGFDLGHPAMRRAFTAPATRRYFGPRNAITADVQIPLDPEQDPADFRWHGTAVAGLIGARRGTAGAAGGCRVLPVRVNPPSGSNVAGGLRWASLQGARIANLSLSVSGQPNYLELAITDLVQAGMLIFAAAGNWGPGNHPVKFPARLPEVVAVGASVPGGARKSIRGPADEQWQSASGPTLDVLAPGVLIPTIDARGAAGYNAGGPGRAVRWFTTSYPGPEAGDAEGDFLFVFTGTSAAVAHASSLAGLILSKNAALTRGEVRAIIESTCDKAGGLAYGDDPGHPNGPWSLDGGYGRINAAAALAKVP